MDIPNIIRKCLDSSDDKVNSQVEEALKEAGVETPEHLKYIKEEDIAGVLSKIKARMFIKALQDKTKIKTGLL